MQGRLQWLWEEPEDYRVVTYLFLKGLALIYLAAFLSLAGQIEGIHFPVGGQGFVVEQPVVEIAAETVDQHHRLTALAALQVAQLVAIDLDLLGGRPLVFRVALGGLEAGLEIGHKRARPLVEPGNLAHEQRIPEVLLRQSGVGVVK